MKAKKLKVELEIEVGCLDCKNFRWVNEEECEGDFTCAKKHFDRKNEELHGYIFCDNDYEAKEYMIMDIIQNGKNSIKHFKITE